MITMKRLALAAVPLALAACFYGPPPQGAVMVGVRPPGYRVEVMGVSPGPDYAWIAGYWAWGGAEYTWVPGRWVARPYARAVWEPGRWHGARRGWYWAPGHWRR